MTEIKKLTGAFNTIGSVFTEMYQHVDRQTGVVTDRNRLGFLQDKVLNGICYQLANAMDYTVQKTLPQAQDRVKSALRRHDGTEIAENQLAEAIDWVERLNEQLALVEASYAAATAVYLKHTGKDFVHGRVARVNEGVEESAAVARAKALGLTGNVGAGYGSNRAN